MDVRPARPADFVSIRLRPEQEHSRSSLLTCANHPDIVEHAWCGHRGNTILAIAGIQPRWPGHGTAWAFISSDIRGREWVSITREVRDHADRALATGYRRIESWCYAEPVEWAEVASRWLERLGFEYEGRARQFTPEGDDMLIYARVRHG